VKARPDIAASLTGGDRKISKRRNPVIGGLGYVAGAIVAGAGITGDHVSFKVAPGTTLGLIGPNGAGKTTLVGDAVCGFLPRYGG
jgi:hypothetical protein